MSECAEVIGNVVAKEIGYSEFLEAYGVRPAPEQVYRFFQVFLREFYREITENGFKVSPSNRIRYLETRNEALEAKVRQYREEFSKIKTYEAEAFKRVIGDLPEYTKSALRLQAFWKGVKIRNNLPKIVAGFRKNFVKKSLNPNEKIVSDVKLALGKLNLTLENAYRACDVGGDGVVTTEEFSRFLQQLKLKLPQRTIFKFIEILDNNYSGNIERDEFYDCLDAFSAASENHFMKGEPYSIRVLRKFKELSESLNFNIVSFFQKSENKNEIPTDFFLKTVKNEFDLVDQELQSLSTSFDLKY